MKLQIQKIKNFYDNKLKNRYGQADVNKGVAFYGEVGMFMELPKPDSIIDYESYLTLSTNVSKNIDDEIKSDKNLFNF